MYSICTASVGQLGVISGQLLSINRLLHSRVSHMWITHLVMINRSNCSFDHLTPHMSITAVMLVYSAWRQITKEFPTVQGQSVKFINLTIIIISGNLWITGKINFRTDSIDRHPHTHEKNSLTFMTSISIHYKHFWNHHNQYEVLESLRAEGWELQRCSSFSVSSITHSCV